MRILNLNDVGVTTDDKKEREPKKQKTPLLSSVNRITLGIVVCAIIAIPTATLMIEKIFDFKPWENVYYRFGLVAIAILVIANWATGRISIEPFRSLGKFLILVAIFCMIATGLLKTDLGKTMRGVGNVFMKPEDKKPEDKKPDDKQPQAGNRGQAMKKESPLESSASSGRSGSTIYISGPGAPGFDLEPNQSTNEWLNVGDGLKYSFTSDGPGFIVQYKKGDMVNVLAGQTNVQLPPYAGPFKIVAGNQKVRVTLVISRIT